MPFDSVSPGSVDLLYTLYDELKKAVGTKKLEKNAEYLADRILVKITEKAGHKEFHIVKRTFFDDLWGKIVKAFTKHNPKKYELRPSVGELKSQLSCITSSSPETLQKLGKVLTVILDKVSSPVQKEQMPIEVTEEYKALDNEGLKHLLLSYVAPKERDTLLSVLFTIPESDWAEKIAQVTEAMNKHPELFKQLKGKQYDSTNIINVLLRAKLEDLTYVPPKIEEQVALKSIDELSVQDLAQEGQVLVLYRLAESAENETYREAYCINLTLFITSSLKEGTVPLSLSDQEVGLVLRYSTRLSTEDTLYLIDALCTPENLSSPYLKEFLLTAVERGDTPVMQALEDKGVDFDALFRQEAEIAAEKGEAYVLAKKMVEKYSPQEGGGAGAPIDAKVADSQQTVILLPKEGVVLKHGSGRMHEDEQLAANLFHLAKADAILATVTLADISQLKFNVPAKDEQKVAGLKEVEAKPFMAGMKVLAAISAPLREKMFERLDTNSQANAILLSELQFYDLHSDNLGMQLVKSAENEGFREATFEVERATLSFDELVEQYLLGGFQPTSEITYRIGNVIHKGTLNDLPELGSALQEAKYQLVIFDTDMNFAETNGAHYGEFTYTDTKNNKISVSGHYIPFRSCLLEQPFKDREVSREMLAQTSKHDREMLNWLRSSHAPIYNFMKQEAKDEVMQMVETLASAPTYSLSYAGNWASDAQIATLRKSFSARCAAMNTPEKRDFWEKVQLALSEGSYLYHTVKEGETLDSIARQLNMDKDALVALNPHTSFQPGSKLSIKADLLSDEGKPLREKIAAMLFPQVSCFQLRAYEERLASRKEYLQNVDTLPKATAHELEKILNAHSTPLSSFAKEPYRTRIAELKINFDKQAYEGLVQELSQAMKPTYFNLMKAMYPLLADAWEVIALMARPNPGRHVGSYTMPLETIIAKAKATHTDFVSGQKIAFLETHLAEEIERSKIKNAHGVVICEPQF